MGLYLRLMVLCNLKFLCVFTHLNTFNSIIHQLLADKTFEEKSLSFVCAKFLSPELCGHLEKL